MVHRDGTLPRFTSNYFRFIDSKTAIIVLANADKAYPKMVVLRITAILFDERPTRAN